jgi:hypothetical protein
MNSSSQNFLQPPVTSYLQPTPSTLFSGTPTQFINGIILSACQQEQVTLYVFITQSLLLVQISTTRCSVIRLYETESIFKTKQTISRTLRRTFLILTALNNNNHTGSTGR